MPPATLTLGLPTSILLMRLLGTAFTFGTCFLWSSVKIFYLDLVTPYDTSQGHVTFC